jgi:tRNA(Ile)-lysidine synthase
MTFDAEILLSTLQKLTMKAPPSRWLVAFSGGMDSTVLLHALSACRNEMPQEIVAVHINHGMHRDAGRWEQHCERIASTFDVSYLCQRVTVTEERAHGPEAAARDARYAALRNFVRAGDCLLSAHHEEDQAETLLLNLLRGSGFAGLAGIGLLQPFASGHLIRPLLNVSQKLLQRYAEEQDLEWLDDPSNSDVRFDRNYLRKEVVPLLATRWPAVSSSLRKSAQIASESNDLLNELADLDLLRHDSADRLSVTELTVLSKARQRNMLRRAVSICGLPAPPASRLYQAVNELIPAREDAQPHVHWHGAEFRRYRDRLFVMPETPQCGIPPSAVLLPDGSEVQLMPGMGSLRLVGAAVEGIDPALVRDGLSVRYRQGGEEVRLPGHDCTHKLKKLLQQDGVLPWMRERLPLLYCGDKLVAIADMWVAAECVAQHGLAVRWDGRPVLR